MVIDCQSELTSNLKLSNSRSIVPTPGQFALPLSTEISFTKPNDNDTRILVFRNLLSESNVIQVITKKQFQFRDAIFGAVWRHARDHIIIILFIHHIKKFYNLLKNHYYFSTIIKIISS